MRTLLEAIGTYYITQAIAAEAELYAYTAPQGRATPYITYTVVSERPEMESFDVMPEGVLLQFSIWSAKAEPDEAIGLRDKLRRAFDDARFSIIGGSLIRCKWEAANLLQEPDGEGWGYHVDYRILTQ